MYDDIDVGEPAQPNYEILPGEAGEMAQYLAVIPGQEEASQPMYLDIHPQDEDIYSDISDTVEQKKQQVFDEDDQELYF